MSVSRPPSPPGESAPIGIEEVSIPVQVSIQPSSPTRTSSTDSASCIASPQESSRSRKNATSAPTNTLIITPLPLAFFEPKILDALKAHFASFSTTFIHRKSPYSPVSAPGPGASIKGHRQNSDAGSEKSDETTEDHSIEGDLYSFVPLKSFRRAIVVYFSAEDAEQARIASDRLQIPATPKSPAVTLRAFRGPETVLVEEGWFPDSIRRDSRGISDDAEEGSWYFGGYPMLPSGSFDDGEIRESPFHLRPPVPERNFLISPPGSPPVGWISTREDPPNEIPLAEDLREALERLKATRTGRRRRSSRQDRFLSGRSRSISTDGSVTHSGEEDGVILIPESAAGLCVRVEDWGTRRLARLHQSREKGKRRVKSKGAEEPEHGPLTDMEDDLDKELQVDEGMFGTEKVDWNRIDHLRTKPIIFGKKDNSDSDTDIHVEPVEEDDDGDEENSSLYLSQNQMFSSGKSITVKMPKKGVKPKPASMSTLPPELGLPGDGNGLGFKPTAMPPFRPTAMPPLKSDASPL